jgi:uncharacterized repeat protein (TIGR04138 family)
MAGIIKDFGDVVDQILKEDKRYEKGAYYFIRNALEHTLKARKKSGKVIEASNAEHVTGQELVDGVCEYALDQYGPMAITVFENWGVMRFEDFGEVVFNLVEYGVFGKTGTDTKEDFKSDVSFQEKFKMPFLSTKAKQRLKESLSGPKKVVMVEESSATKAVKRKIMTKRPPSEEGSSGTEKKPESNGKEKKSDKNKKSGDDA